MYFNCSGGSGDIWCKGECSGGGVAGGGGGFW